MRIVLFSAVWTSISFRFLGHNNLKRCKWNGLEFNSVEMLSDGLVKGPNERENVVTSGINW